MKIDSLRWRQLLMFGLFALGSYAMYQQFQVDRDGVQYEPFTKGYALLDVVITGTDETGQIQTTLESPSVIHYADSEETHIKDPILRMHEADGDWVFSAANAMLSPDRNQIQFPESVNLYLDAKEPDEMININTTALNVFLDRQQGLTKEKILIDQTGHFLEGDGALVDFKQQQIEFLENMYAKFEN